MVRRNEGWDGFGRRLKGPENWGNARRAVGQPRYNSSAMLHTRQNQYTDHRYNTNSRAVHPVFEDLPVDLFQLLHRHIVQRPNPRLPQRLHKSLALLLLELPAPAPHQARSRLQKTLREAVGGPHPNRRTASGRQSSHHKLDPRAAEKSRRDQAQLEGERHAVAVDRAFGSRPSRSSLLEQCHGRRGCDLPDYNQIVTRWLRIAVTGNCSR